MRKQKPTTAGTIGSRFREVRLKQNLTQREFCKILGISQTHIASIELGRDNPSRTLKLLLSYCMDINYEWLESGTGEKYCLSELNDTSLLKDLYSEARRMQAEAYQFAEKLGRFIEEGTEE
ncbi:MAG: helix-turn-helix domain-containing protein [Oscillospiraceae bacterium]|nr:helix-turn-helix domain-containing protein [Oscillospiraceae bacterium]